MTVLERHHRVIAAVGALVGGLVSGIWWPNNWLAGGIGGVIGAECFIGLAYDIEWLRKRSAPEPLTGAA